MMANAEIKGIVFKMIMFIQWCRLRNLDEGSRDSQQYEVNVVYFNRILDVKHFRSEIKCMFSFQLKQSPPLVN